MLSDCCFLPSLLSIPPSPSCFFHSPRSCFSTCWFCWVSSSWDVSFIQNFGPSNSAFFSASISYFLVSLPWAADSLLSHSSSLFVFLLPFVITLCLPLHWFLDFLLNFISASTFLLLSFWILKTKLLVGISWVLPSKKSTWLHCGYSPYKKPTIWELSSQMQMQQSMIVSSPQVLF